MGEEPTESRSRLRSPRTLIRIALAAAFLILVAGGIRAARNITQPEPLAGIELGMSLDEVRGAFEPPASGFFMVGSAEGEPLLEWHPRGRAADAPAGARFQFAEGALVEARFGWPPGTDPADAATQLGLAAGEDRWGLGAATATLERHEGGALEIVYAD